MKRTQNHLVAGVTAVLLSLVAQSVSWGVTDEEFNALKARLAELESKDQALKAQVAELKQKESENWLNEERTAQVKVIVEQTIADAKTRGDFANGANVGYNNGFYIQSADNNFKISIGGVLQTRYEYALHHADDTRFATPPLTQGETVNASGFDIRRARINLTGYVFSPNLFYRFEGDFYGSNTGAFTVTDAYGGYIFNDQFKVRVGSFKTPFTKAELVYDANLELERSEVNFPFDAQRSLGVSLFGDIIKNTLSYEVNANDGSKSNTFRYVDTYSNVTTVSSTSTPSYNLDNRLAFYSRMQYSGSGTISEFYDGGEADLRKDTSHFIWMFGGAGGYESQNSGGAAYPQNTLSVVGLGSNDSPGFAKAYVLNGDIYRATADWSAKYQGWSFNTAAYFQEVNANPFAVATGSSLPYGVNKSSFFQHAYSAQAGYMILPRKLQIVGRVGYLFDEGDPNIAAFYTLGANYYLFGNNAKILADVNYSPEAAYTDASTLQIANTSEVVVRMQFQLKF